MKMVKKLNLVILTMCACLKAYAQAPAYQRSPWTTNTPGSINAFATNTTIMTNLQVRGVNNSLLFQVNTNVFAVSNNNATLGYGVLGKGNIYGNATAIQYGYFDPYNLSDGNTYIYNNGPYNIFFFTSGQNRMRIDDAGRVGIGGAPTNNFHVLGSETITGNSLIVGSMTASNIIWAYPRWKDEIVGGLTLRGGLAAPTVSAISVGSVIYGLNFQLDDDASGVVQFNHGLASTNAFFPNLYVSPHVHLAVTNIAATTSNGVFQLDYQWAAIGSVYLSTVGTLYTTNVFTVVNTHYISGFGTITNNAVQGGLSSIFRFRIKRINSGAGDIGSGAGNMITVDSFDVHAPFNQIGSTGPTSP